VILDANYKGSGCTSKEKHDQKSRENSRERMKKKKSSEFHKLNQGLKDPISNRII